MAPRLARIPLLLAAALFAATGMAGTVVQFRTPVGDVEVRRREQRARPLRPFDEAQGIRSEVFPEARAYPFRVILEPIKIKVIQV